MNSYLNFFLNLPPSSSDSISRNEELWTHAEYADEGTDIPQGYPYPSVIVPDLLLVSLGLHGFVALRGGRRDLCGVPGPLGVLGLHPRPRNFPSFPLELSLLLCRKKAVLPSARIRNTNVLYRTQISLSCLFIINLALTVLASSKNCKIDIHFAL